MRAAGDIEGRIRRAARDSGRDFGFATRLRDWSAGGLLQCIVLPVRPCVVSFSKFCEPDTHDLLRTRMSRGRHEETASVEFKLKQDIHRQ